MAASYGEETKAFTCICGAPAHTMIIDGRDDELLSVYVHLTRWGFLKRVWYGIRYIFWIGQEPLGVDYAFDCVLLDRPRVEKVHAVLGEWLIENAAAQVEAGEPPS